jgi:tripartite-type tricarboxylate transporter receptor subunit TctC
VVNPSLFPKLPFDIEKDLAPVSLVASAPYVIAAHPSVPAKSVRELIAFAKAKPGMLKYASAGNGTNLHVAAELFKNLSGVDIVHVPYRGGGPALTAVLGGESDLSFLALAITSSARSPVKPDLPTVAEAGVPGYEFTSWVGILAPAATPARIVAAINDYIVKAMRAPGVTERFASEGADVIANSPAQFGAQIKAELVRWAKVVKENQLKAD